MNTSEMFRKLQKIDETVIRSTAIEAVLQNEEIVVIDAISTNIEGFTFAGNQISKYPPFKDWEQSGKFHANVRFENTKDIGFTSNGDGAEAIFNTFPEVDTQAPTAKILSGEAIKDITTTFNSKLL